MQVSSFVIMEGDSLKLCNEQSGNLKCMFGVMTFSRHFLEI